VQQSVVVTPASQTINFTAPTSPVSYAKGLTVALSATGGSSGNPVVFSVDGTSTGTGTISGKKLTVTGAGTLVIDASQAGSGNYSAATLVQQSVVVTPASQTINFTAPISPVSYAKGLVILLSAQGGGSGNPVVFGFDNSSTGSGTISGKKLTVTGAGTLVIDANQAGNANYSAASQAQQSVVVNKIAQTINFIAPKSPVNFTKGLTIALSATGGGSGNAVVFSLDGTSTGTGTISGKKLTVTGAGTLVIDANQAGNANYGAASQAQQSVVVNKIAQTINFIAPKSPENFTKGLTLLLVAQGGGSGSAIVFSLDKSSTGTGTISGRKLTVTGAGNLVINANQAGNSYYAAAAQAQATVEVDKIPQVIVFTQPKSPVTYHKGLVITLHATGGVSGVPVVFSLDGTSTATGTISGNKLTVTSAGNLVIDANQAGTVNRSAAQQVQRTVVVTPAS